MRVVHIGLGSLGRVAAGELVRRGLELVAAVDPSPEIAGRALSDLVPGAPARLRVAADLDELPDADAALVTTVSDVPGCAATFRALLERGLTVVSSCEQLVWPRLRHAELADELDALARRHGARLFGTGVNPGFLMDAFPLLATAISRTVERVEVQRVQDAALRRASFQAKIGAGMDPAAFRELLAKGEAGHAGLAESLHLLAHGLGIALDEWEERAEPVIAEHDLDSALGTVARGRVCGVRQEARGTGGGVELELVFRAVLGEADPRDRIVIHGQPMLEVAWDGGVHGDDATCAMLVNALPALARATPGLHTALTAPTPTWFA
jgi:4-hydroxy-tetrahydrodipicolinate reductase